jgi:hypothetical protein
MKYTFSNTGNYIFAIALAAIAIIQFVTGAMPSSLAPFPKDMPGQEILAYVSGLIFLSAAIAVFINKKAVLLLTTAAMVFVLLLAYPHIPKLLSNVYNAGEWVVFLETLAFICGCFILAARLEHPSHTIVQRTAIVCRYLFAMVLVVFGIQHIMYEQFIIALIPAWMPVKIFWARLVTVAFLATALSIGINIATRLATSLLGIMFFTWVCILHAPRVAIRPGKEAEWTSMFIAFAMCGICLMIAATQKCESEVGRRKTED